MNNTTKRNIKEALLTRISQMRGELHAELTKLTTTLSPQSPQPDSHYWRWQNGLDGGKQHFAKGDEVEDRVRKYAQYLESRCKQIEELVTASKEVEKLVPDDQQEDTRSSQYAQGYP